VAAFVAAGLVCGSAFSDAAEREGFKLASPEMVALAGFAPGTELWVPVAAPEAMGDPSNYFGTQPAMTGYMGDQFAPRVSTLQWNTTNGAGEMTYASGDIFADAQINLPTGVQLDGFRYWANDAVAQDANYFLITSCLPAAGPGAPVFTAFGPVATTGAGGEQSGTLALTNVIDNNTCSYFIRINFGGGVGLANRRVRLQWHRQVSAAPATATFSDVPTSHPFFRFVEALAAAGITGGCTPTTYCPNGNLTRGEMAVFLSTALGLHFPN
jgi:hypothetical protein